MRINQLGGFAIKFLIVFKQYIVYRKIVQFLSIFCLILLLVFGFPTHAFATPSTECSKFWGGEIPLAENLKNILVSGVKIPVNSPDIADVSSFKNLIIVYHVKEEQKGILETGNQLNVSYLKNATGYAKVEFRVNEPLREIPVIKAYLNSEYPDIYHVQYPDVSRFINISTKVGATLLFNDSSNKTVLSHEFDLKEFKNEIPICDFENIKTDIKTITVKIKSFSFHGEIDISINHLF
ncbi:MAG: hypothetical protein WBV73_28910 [Phormidium sp.]